MEEDDEACLWFNRRVPQQGVVLDCFAGVRTLEKLSPEMHWRFRAFCFAGFVVILACRCLSHIASQRAG